jgi:hypothetical protein
LETEKGLGPDSKENWETWEIFIFITF